VQLALGSSHGKFVVKSTCEDLVCDWKIYSQRECYKSVARKQIVQTSGNRLSRLAWNDC
jgi:hypothetical protein